MTKYLELLNIIKNKVDILMERVDPSSDNEPRGISTGGKYTSEFSCFYKPGWTYSFYLGMVALMYVHTNDTKYIEYLEKAERTYTFFLWGNEEEIGHDSGFLYSLYAVAMYKLTGKVVYKHLALKAADEIGKRYRFEARHMQAFYDLRIRGETDRTTHMIVDDMMNMNLLMWAYKTTGHSFYREVYKNHIETAIKYLIRDDYSVRHAYHFDAVSGRALTEANICGYSVGSHWARGTAWMIYGLAKALEFSGDKARYLSALEGVSREYLKNIEDNPVPIWDFRLPADEEQIRDSSAAAITASAFLSFDKVGVNTKITQKAVKTADMAIEELSKNEYFGSEDVEYILKYQNEEGALWGDYFFAELLMKKVYGDKLVDFWI